MQRAGPSQDIKKHRPSLTVEALAALAFWVFASALYAVLLGWVASEPGRRIDLRNQLTWQITSYLGWVPITVIVWRLTSAWLPSAMGWPRYLSRHLALAFAAAVAHCALGTVAAQLIVGPAPESFGVVLVGILRSRGYLEALVYAGIVASGHAIWLYDQWRTREADALGLEAATSRLSAALSTARLGALQAQVHPHFLFNSLHAVASLARDGRNADVVKMIADLSDLLRRVIEPQASTLPLSEEVDLARRYLDIQGVRFADRLRVQIDVPHDALAIEVPALTLQPLIDNAVRHGVSPSVQGGLVRVVATLANQVVTIRVDDDGVGPPEGWSLERTTGTGLANLRERLAILYGDAASLRAGASESGRFSVVVAVPVSP